MRPRRYSCIRSCAGRAEQLLSSGFRGRDLLRRGVRSAPGPGSGAKKSARGGLCDLRCVSLCSYTHWLEVLSFLRLLDSIIGCLCHRCAPRCTLLQLAERTRQSHIDLLTRAPCAHPHMSVHASKRREGGRLRSPRLFTRNTRCHTVRKNQRQAFTTVDVSARRRVG